MIAAASAAARRTRGRTAPPREFAFLVDDPDLRIKHWPGAGPRLVVAFTGVGLGHGGMQTDEFVGSGSAGRANHVVCVIDRRRSWFSSADLRDRVVALLAGLRARLAITDVVTIGNSMGGYAALLFAERLGARVAIAFVPQASVSPAVVTETRWPQFRAGVALAEHLSLPGILGAGTSHYAIYGDASAPDLRHAHLLEDAGRVRVFRVAGADHGIAMAIKEAGLLPALTAALMDDNAADVAAILHQFEAFGAAGVPPAGETVPPLAAKE